MNISDISPWYYVAALLLAGAVFTIYALTDRRTFRQSQLSLAMLTAQMGGAVLLLWAVGQWSTWWAMAFVVAVVGGAHVVQAVKRGWQTYLRSRQHTRDHYEYLLGNGASRLEAVMPSVRRSLRAVVVPVLQGWGWHCTSAPLLLLLGLLLAGASPLAAVVATLLFTLALLGLGVVLTVLLIWLRERRQR